jgi:hypothetical protein
MLSDINMSHSQMREMFTIEIAMKCHFILEILICKGKMCRKCSGHSFAMTNLILV